MGEPRRAAVRLAHPARRRLRRLRARHLRAVGLDAARHAPLHGAARADAAEHGAGARSARCSPTSRRSPARSSAELRALGRLPEPMLRRARRARLSRRRRGTRRSIASPRELRAADPARARVLPDVARHHQRGLLRGAEGGALPRHATTSTTRRASATPRRRSAMKATLGYGASTCSYADWLDADLIVLFGSNVAEQPAGHDEVPARRQGERRADRRRQPVPRARAGALLGAVDRVERAVRHGARRSLVRRAHRRRPGVPRRRAAGARSRSAASTRRSSRAHDGLRGGARPRRSRRRLGRARARERRDRATDRGVRARC